MVVMCGRREGDVILWLHLSVSVALYLGAVIFKHLYLFPSGETGSWEGPTVGETPFPHLRQGIGKLFSPGESVFVTENPLGVFQYSCSSPPSARVTEGIFLASSVWEFGSIPGGKTPEVWRSLWASSPKEAFTLHLDLTQPPGINRNYYWSVPTSLWL